MRKKIIGFPRLIAEKRAIETMLFTVLKKELCPGTVVTWKHGEYLQQGHVLEVIGAPWSPSIRVQNDRTRRMVDISIERIEAVYEGGAA